MNSGIDMKNIENIITGVPDDIEKAVISSRTSLGSNPAIPDIYDVPYLKKLTERAFSSSVNKLLSVFGEVDMGNPEETLAKLLNECKEKERPYRNQLEKICFNTVIEMFAVPQETVDIRVSLKDDISANSSVINLDPIDGDDDMEFSDISDAKELREEVLKRRFLDAVCMGAGMEISSATELFSKAIEKIDPDLITIYQRIIALNSYCLFLKNDIGLTDENKMQLGTVEVSLGSEENKVRIDAQGVIFPILLCELIQGFIELFVSHGLPEDKARALSVIGKADFLKAEPWDMRLGPELWKLLEASFNDINSNELPYLLKRISMLPVNKFNYLMKEVLAKTKKGKSIMSNLSAKAKNDAEYEKFVDRMDKMKQDRGLIADDYIHPEEL